MCEVLPLSFERYSIFSLRINQLSFLFCRSVRLCCCCVLQMYAFVLLIGSAHFLLVVVLYCALLYLML